jgi:NADH:ubiquinone oxidoreductase subunit 3 (subunit A)
VDYLIHAGHLAICIGRSVLILFVVRMLWVLGVLEERKSKSDDMSHHSRHKWECGKQREEKVEEKKESE